MSHAQTWVIINRSTKNRYSTFSYVAITKKEVIDKFMNDTKGLVKSWGEAQKLGYDAIKAYIVSADEYKSLISKK